MAEAIWHRPFNYHDAIQAGMRELNVRDTLPYGQFYGEAITNALALSGMLGGSIKASGAMPMVVQDAPIPIHHAAQMGVIEPMAELMWNTFNRPTWFCDHTMLELLKTARIDDDLRGIHWPAECLYLCFEKGAMIRGFPLRSIMVFTPRSDLTARTVQQVVKKVGLVSDLGLEQVLGRLMGVWVDCLDGPEYTIRPDGMFTTRNRLYIWRKYEQPTPPNEMENVNDEERLAAIEGVHIAAAAMLYHAARPELVAPYNLPRSQRYTFRGERSNYRRLMLPGIKVLRDPSLPQSEGTGSAKSPHYRGWVMRTLRDPRYRRNEDGTYRTVLVAPTAIHPERMGDNPDESDSFPG